MKKTVGMDELPDNSIGKIVNINLDGEIKKKLMAMGMVKGTEFKIDGRAPLGDPLKINVRGYYLTLRKSEAKNILVEKLQ